MRRDIIQNSLKNIKKRFEYKYIEDDEIKKIESLLEISVSDDEKLKLLAENIPPMAVRESDALKILFYYGGHNYLRIAPADADISDILLVLLDEFRNFNLLNAVNSAELFGFYCRRYEKKNGESKIDYQTRFLRVAGQKPAQENIEFLERLEKSCAEYRKKIILTGCGSKDVIQQLELFGEKERFFFLDLFGNGNYSLNHKRKILEFSFDILKRDNLQFSALSDIILHFAGGLKENSNIAEALTKELFSIRFPELERNLKELEKKVNALKSGKINFYYDRSLESDEIRCDFALTDFAKLNKIISL